MSERRDCEQVVTAVAHPNIALAKYWGKRAGQGNFPAVPSLSVTLSGMSTTTHVQFDRTLAADSVMINGEAQYDSRVVALLDRVRAAAEFRLFARVVSVNDFPTASGLASSASGFAALALAATHAATLEWDAARISDLARRSSASAARSIFGGFVELDAGQESGDERNMLAAQQVAPIDYLPLTVLVCVTTEQKKSIGSTDAMTKTAQKSPFYDAWLRDAPAIHASLKSALLARDRQLLGELTEASTWAMHATAMAAGIVYLRSATIDAIECVRSLRASGTAAYMTMDAGPHVKVFTAPEDAPRVKRELAAVNGVLRVIETQPGEGARNLL